MTGWPWTASTSSSPGGRSTASSGPTARARRRPSGCCSAWSSPRRAPGRCSGTRCRRRRGRPCDTWGALVEGPAFHPYLSGRRNLARLDAADRWSDPRTARRRIDEALDRVGLLAAATKRYRAYSLGMRQRLAIAAALLAPRELLVLDEPTNGLDPQGTREVRHLVESLAHDGATVLVSSHLLSEVEQICTHLGVMSEGRLVAQGTTQELRGRWRVHRAGRDRQPAQAAAVLARVGLVDVDTGPGTVRATPGPPGSLDAEAVVAALVARRRRGARVRGDDAEPGGPVRRSDGGGLRCQWLSGAAPRRPGRPRQPATRAARTPPGLHPPAALRGRPHRRAPPQPDGPARAGPRAHRPRGLGQGLQPVGPWGTGLPRLDHGQRPVRPPGRAHGRDGAVPPARHRHALRRRDRRRGQPRHAALSAHGAGRPHPAARSSSTRRCASAPSGA